MKDRPYPYRRYTYRITHEGPHDFSVWQCDMSGNKLDYLYSGYTLRHAQQYVGKRMFEDALKEGF